MNENSTIANKGLLLGPSISTQWQPQDVWNTGFADAYSTNLAWLSVEHYPEDNCAVAFNTGGTVVDPQAAFPSYLTHVAAQNLVNPYTASTGFAQSKGKPFIMFETNIASCGGFVGISDSFGAALWGIDYALQMAYGNFSGCMFHVGGQSVFYNPFTPPPTNQSSFHQWTIGPIYYAALVTAEAIGSSGKAQVQDIFPNNGNEFTPGYAIYEDGQPVRVALLNYINDPSGANNYQASISVPSNPSSIKIKTLRADSVSQKGGFTWANQTFGGNFDSDGRPMGGDENGNAVLETVQCNNGVCAVTVPAPGMVLVFLTNASLGEVEGDVHTFSTTVRTKIGHTATVDPSVLATSNGHKAQDLMRGSTSRGKSAAGRVTESAPRFSFGLGLATAVAVVLSGF
jgi:hypothetical protein